ncbi:hypothetical protein [Streptomyces sp. NPDC015414]|uniref:hypothetical protein n=1 Tax=Streptomyces sp. NPDC015414 TaxID=3364957 RepID=UPI003702AE0D
MAKVVNGHQDIWQCRLAVVGAGGQQSPDAGWSSGGENGMAAAVTVAGLGHAADVFDLVLGKVATQQDLHDGSGGFGAIGGL